MAEVSKTQIINQVIHPHSKPRRLLRYAMEDSYAMQESLVRSDVCARIIDELEDMNLLEDYIELKPSGRLAESGMYYSALLHTALASIVMSVDTSSSDPLPLFSVRVFEPDHYSTTIHRNDPTIGPWAIGVTLAGEAPFNVYEQHQLPNSRGATIELDGTKHDPEPLESMQAGVGSAWVLHTANEQMPHSGGLVESAGKRILLLFYGYDYADEFKEHTL